MAGPITTFVEDIGVVIKGVFDVIVFDKTPNGGPLSFRPDNTPVSSFVTEVEAKAAEALRKLTGIEAGISGRGMPDEIAPQARQVVVGARTIVTRLTASIQSSSAMSLRALKATPAFSEGLLPMVQWFVPPMRRGFESSAPILAEWFSIASRFRCLIIGTIAVGGLLAWNRLDRQNYC